MNLNSLKPKVNEILEQEENSVRHKMQEVCELLLENVTTYDWVGFYMTHETEPTLHLWSQAGDPTNHTVIPFGKGICGQVAVSNKNFVVPDVKAQDNYIACSIHVKSEIVIPLFKNGKNIGQIDIDSHTRDAFSEEDEKFLEWVNANVAIHL